MGHGGPQFTFAIPNDGLQPGFGTHAPFPEPIEQALPVWLGFPLGEFPIENFAPATAIGPQSQGYSQHHELALALLSPSPATVRFQGARRYLQSQPSTIELDHRRHLCNMGVVSLREQGRKLVDVLIERAQSNTTPYRLTPALTYVPQTFTQPAAQNNILIQIQPEALIFLQDREVADHIMTTLLTFQHRHSQPLDAAPARLQAAPIMAIACEVLRISAATLSRNRSQMAFARGAK